MRLLLIVLLLAALCLTLFQARVLFIRSFFTTGPSSYQQCQSAIAPPSREDMVKKPTTPLRVVLIDGLNRYTAKRLPTFRQVCKSGLALEVDVGFPSVSLPVQHVLWTGRWQNQTGVLFAISQLEHTVGESLPELLHRYGEESIAIAEGHREIAGSFPFSRLIAPRRSEEPLSADVLEREALTAIRSRAALVFIHSLAVDEAGHAHGAISPRYYQTAKRADDLLAAIWKSRQPNWTLLVISDHGHLPWGGHGDSEPEVKLAPACLTGPGIPAGIRLHVTMPDVNHLLAERLGFPPPNCSVGRTLAEIMNGSAAPKQILRPFPYLGLSIAVVFFVLGYIGIQYQQFRQQKALSSSRLILLGMPWSLFLTWLFLIIWQGSPSLSQSYIYARWSPKLLMANVPGILFLGLQLWTILRQKMALTTALFILGYGFTAPALASLVITGWPWHRPPLFPQLTGWSSTLLFSSALLLAALVIWLIFFKIFKSFSFK